MTKHLVIVESPSKSKTIEKYLGSDYKVVSSKGHIRDLSTKGQYGLGVDIENGFKPDYVAVKGKSALIKELKKDVKDSDYVYLATDPDREGEAISCIAGIQTPQHDRHQNVILCAFALLQHAVHPRQPERQQFALFRGLQLF